MKASTTSKKLLAALLAAAMSVSMAACGQTGNNSGDADRISAESVKEDNQAAADTQETADAQEQTDTESTKHTEYPVTITTYGRDGAEYTTTYEKAPEKVLAVYQGCVETMLALGLEDHLVATAGLDNAVPDDQKAAFSQVEYLDEFTPSKETVTMLEPDLIFSWVSLFGEKALGDAQSWIDNGTNVYISSNTAVAEKSLENEYNDILNMGIIFDVQDKAEALVNEMKDTIESVKTAAASESASPSVLVIESGKDSFTNYNATSLAGDMVTQLGGTLANADGASLGKEDIIAADPDVIFVVYMPYTGDDPETVKQEKLNVILEDEAYASLSAVQNGRVVPIMLSEMYASATRTQDGIETIARGLYPELELNLGE
ncbi:MAG: ABC transporter substrate-binding protein [Eubacteriales bacterium]|nr:ABC transporter substrate-binding protein [Eubacteriales bacterium]